MPHGRPGEAFLRALPEAGVGRWRQARLVHSGRSSPPLVSFRFLFRGGAGLDPPGREGLAALTARMLDRGTATRDRQAIATEIETLGATLQVGAGQESIFLAGQVLSRSFPRLLEVVSDLLLHPAFPEQELEQARGEMLGEVALAREEDRDLGELYLRRAVYGEEPYGRFVDGTGASLPRIGRDEVVARWREVAGASNLVVGVAGDVAGESVEELLEAHLGALPAGNPVPPLSIGHRKRHGFEALVVDKPDRTQTQLFLGQTAVSALDPRFLPLSLGLHTFGGMFTSRLMQEVRVKRGWSYGASARVELNRGPGLLTVWTFPGNDDTIECIRLLLQLLQELKALGTKHDELESARSHLLNMLAFEVETPEQLVQRRIQQILLGLPEDWTGRFVAGIEGASVEQANQAIREIVDPEGLVLVAVATADRFRKDLEGLPGLRRLSRVAFDAADPSEWTLEWNR